MVWRNPRAWPAIVEINCRYRRDWAASDGARTLPVFGQLLGVRRRSEVSLVYRPIGLMVAYIAGILAILAGLMSATLLSGGFLGRR